MEGPNVTEGKTRRDIGDTKEARQRDTRRTEGYKKQNAARWKKMRYVCNKLDYVTRMSNSKFKRGIYQAVFDSDSYKIALDNGASFCISNSTRDFLGSITPTQNSVDGIASGIDAT